MSTGRRCRSNGRARVRRTIYSRTGFMYILNNSTGPRRAGAATSRAACGRALRAAPEGRISGLRTERRFPAPGMWPRPPRRLRTRRNQESTDGRCAFQFNILIYIHFLKRCCAAKRLWRECNALRDTAFVALIWFQPWRKEGYEQSASRARSTPLQGCAGKPFRGFPAHPQRSGAGAQRSVRKKKSSTARLGILIWR